MNWEAIAAAGTVFTGLVILVTALTALREVRIAAEHSRSTQAQLDHLRKATQFEGALAVFSELDSPLQREARHFVQFELQRRMRDERYRQEVALVAGADEIEHQELTVLRCFERIGMYVHKDWVDSDAVYAVAAGRVMTAWHALSEVVAIHRQVAGAAFWSNFDRLNRDCRDWQRSRGLNVERLEHQQTFTAPLVQD